MAAKCPICFKTCNNTYAIQCIKCTKWLHCDCINMNKAKLKYYEQEIKNPKGDRWFCDSCKSEVRGNENKTEITNKINETSAKEVTLNDIMEKLQLMDHKQTELLKRYEEQLKVNDELRRDIDDLKAQLDEEKNKNEQKELENNILISGIPSNPNENLATVFRTINQSLKIDIQGARCYRIGRGPNQAGTIKVCFESREDKENFMKAKKEIKLTLSNTRLGTNDNEIYVNHDLTKRNQYIFMMARRFKKDNNYKFVWYSNGNIFIRKDESSKVNKITRVEDLKNC